eukprot:3979933-Pyramimonas_sp.AAC.1
MTPRQPKLARGASRRSRRAPMWLSASPAGRVSRRPKRASAGPQRGPSRGPREWISHRLFKDSG